MNARSILLASVLVVGLGTSSMQAIAQPGAAPTVQAQHSTVTANAAARVYRTPDYLDVQLAVETIAPTAQEAQASCTQTMEKTLAALKALNLDKYEPQTGTVTLQPRYNNYNREEDRRIIGYTAVNTIRVRTTELKASAKVIDTALTAGANRVDGIAFGIKEYLAAREEALAMAVKAAKRKADVIATALDQRLGKVLTVSESSPTYYYSMNRMAQVQTANAAGGEAAAGPGEDAVVPGQIEIVVDVSISFVLENK